MKPSHLLLIWPAILLTVGTVLGALRALGIARAGHRGAFGGPGAGPVARPSLGAKVVNIGRVMNIFIEGKEIPVARGFSETSHRPAGRVAAPCGVSGKTRGLLRSPAGINPLATMGFQPTIELQP
jgi:hypothetical protein